MGIIEQIQFLQAIFVEGDKLFTESKSYVEEKDTYEKRQTMYWELLSGQGKLVRLLDEMQQYLQKSLFHYEMRETLDINFFATDMIFRALQEGKSSYFEDSVECSVSKNQIIFKDQEKEVGSIFIHYDQEMQQIYIQQNKKTFLSLLLESKHLLLDEEFFIDWLKGVYQKEAIYWTMDFVYAVAKGFELLHYQVTLGILTQSDARTLLKQIDEKENSLNQLMLALYDGELNILMEKTSNDYFVEIDETTLQLTYLEKETESYFELHYLSNNQTSFYSLLVEKPTIRDWFLMKKMKD